MSAIVYPRMEVLQSLYELTADITPNRFITTRPNAVGEQMEEFLLIIPKGIYGRGDTYQSMNCQIAVFTRDAQGGLENTLRLEDMQTQVMALFPIVTELYHGKRPLLLPGGSDSVGFHSLIIQFHLTIFKKHLKPL